MDGLLNLIKIIQRKIAEHRVIIETGKDTIHDMQKKDNDLKQLEEVVKLQNQVMFHLGAVAALKDVQDILQNAVDKFISGKL